MKTHPIISSPPKSDPTTFGKKKQNSGPANIAFKQEKEKISPWVYVLGAGIGAVLGNLYMKFRKVKAKK